MDVFSEGAIEVPESTHQDKPSEFSGFSESSEMSDEEFAELSIPVELAIPQEPVISKRQLLEAETLLQEYGYDLTGQTAEEIVRRAEMIEKGRSIHAQSLNRGMVGGMLARGLDYVPKGFVGQFKTRDETHIQAAREKGWEIFKRKPDQVGQHHTLAHDTGDGTVIVGETILMVVPEEIYRVGKMHKLARTRAKTRRRHEANNAITQSGNLTVQGSDERTEVKTLA